ncbi:MAG: integrase domain-containing protein, partial [Rudaea sp.]
GINVRTLQNELSHVRSMLREMGRASIADAPELSNRALGVSGGSRIGKKSAMTQGGYHAARQRAVSVGREGMASLLRLEIELGLRGNEALHARSDTLARWLHEIITSNRILVLDGTKGGRQRFVTIRDKDNALDAIREAQIIAGKQGGFLLVRSDGSPAGGLKEARQIYHSWMSRARVTPHSARYAWAQRNYLLLINSGFKEREALLTIAIELGHGSGRARWVKSTYLRELPKDLTTEQLVALLRKMVWN